MDLHIAKKTKKSWKRKHTSLAKWPNTRAEVSQHLPLKL
jgi:hypothetical protein